MATDWVTASPVRDTQAGETAGANSRRTDHDPAHEGSILSERARLPSSVTDLDGNWRKPGGTLRKGSPKVRLNQGT